MNTSKASGFVKNIQTSLTKHSPEILMSFGFASMASTVIFAVKVTPKACRLIEAKEKELGVEKLTTVETVKTTWKCYIPAAVSAGVSVGCFLGANSVNNKRNAALAAAYTLSDTAFREYREKVVETIGEKKEQIVRDKVAEDKMKKDPVGKKEVIITEKGNTLCYDVISGRYFKSDIDKIKRAENELNKKLLREGYISLNDFYEELGLGYTKNGDDLGWNLDQDQWLEFSFSSQIAEDGTPCLVVDYNVAPKYGYSSFM